VVAASVGGLRTAVRDGVSGLLVAGHDPADYAAAIRRVVGEPGLHRRLAAGAIEHAAQFGWSVTTAQLLTTYREAMGSRWVTPDRLAASS
jgi:D-inositol-3-phosphate glycosyltransferase